MWVGGGGGLSFDTFTPQFMSVEKMRPSFFLTGIYGPVGEYASTSACLFSCVCLFVVVLRMHLYASMPGHIRDTGA